MLLAVDIGNSNIVCGISNEGKWIYFKRFETHPVRGGQYEQNLRSILDEIKVKKADVAKIVISSVVPAATKPVYETLDNLFQPEPVLLNAEFDSGITIETDHPEKVGTDLIADAAAAYHLIRDNGIVVDFGTATTVMSVEKSAVLGGVAICAGLKASKEALVGRAAQLFDVPLQPPPSVLGKNTVEAMQSGLVLGHIAMVEGLINRIKKETGPAKVVATGGFAEMLAPLTDIFDKVEPTLTLDGLRIIAEREMADGKRQEADRKWETADDSGNSQ